MAEPSAEQVVRNGYAAWNSGDFEKFAETIHPEIVWRGSGQFPAIRLAYSGLDELAEFWEAFWAPWETLQIELERLTHIDEDTILLIAHFHARGRDGIEVEKQIPNLLTVRDGKLYRFQAYRTWEEALVATGAKSA